MVVYCVNIYVVPGREDDFIHATKENHVNTRKEPGNIRFDLCQSKEDNSLFFLYEVYESDEAVKSHKETDHYKKWKETVADWMAKPREGTKYVPHLPEDKKEW